MIKAQEEKFQAQDKKFQNQEKRVQKKNETIRIQNKELESNEVEFEADHNLIEKLCAEKRDLQEKNEELAKELKEYKAGFLEAGLTFEIVEEEVDVDEEAKWLTTIYLSYRFIVA
jgi:chromosome segregation ATPase